MDAFEAMSGRGRMQRMGGGAVTGDGGQMGLGFVGSFIYF